MRTIKNIRLVILVILVVFVIFCFQNCKNIQEKENENKFNLNYIIDTLKNENVRYIHESGLGLEWYSIIAPYPVFTSDSIPEILKDFNENIKEKIEHNVIKTMQDHYDKYGFDSDYFPRNYDNRSKTDTGTVEERITDFMNTITKIDTLIFKYSERVYIGTCYVSIGIIGTHWMGWEKINIDSEANPCTFNFLIDENKKLYVGDCFSFKDEMIIEWKKTFINYFYPNVKNDILNQSDSVFFPVDFHQLSENRVRLFFITKYGKALRGTFKINELSSFFEISYLNEKSLNEE